MAVAFIVVATANGAGYRYGVSDQAFYIPVVTRALDPSAFPRDASLIDAQGQLMLSDEVLAALARATGWGLDTLAFGAYLLSMLTVWAGLTLIGASVSKNPWVTVALTAAYTLRHRITKTSANSLEPYYHPRILAFGLGLLAVAALLRRRYAWAVAGVALAAAVHTTTGLWFAVLIGTAIVILDEQWRRLAVPAGLVGTVASLWWLSGNLLQGRFQVMDAVWLQAVSTKDSLFASQWPASAWAANLGLLVALWVAHRYRARHGHASPEDTALVWGATALVGLFLVTLPAVSAGVAFFVQLQIPRVFWLVDAVATVYVVAAVTGVARGSGRRATAIAVMLALLAAGRGLYVMRVERPDRPLVAAHLPQDDWHDVMQWIARQDRTAHVLTDPGHAWRFGTSVRVAAATDVFLEEVKDAALAIYSRDVAGRVVERTAAVGDFSAMTPDHARTLAVRYDLDYLVTGAQLALPEVHRTGRFRVYALTP